MRMDSRLTGRRVVALPFSDFCPPLLADSTRLEQLTENLQNWRREHNVSQIQVHWPLPDNEGIYPGDMVARHVTHLRTEAEQLLHTFGKTQVRGIRRAEREGVQISMSDGWEELRSFYDIHLDTRRRQGTPVQPLRFFRMLWEGLISQNHGFTLLAYKDSQLLAGAVFLHANQTVTYKYSASFPAYWGLRPNNLLLWRSFQWGCEHGYRGSTGGGRISRTRGCVSSSRAGGARNR